MKTGTSGCPSISNKLSVFWAASSGTMFPKEATTPIKSHSGVARAYASAKASSTPVSRSKIILYLAMKSSPLVLIFDFILAEVKPNWRDFFLDFLERTNY